MVLGIDIISFLKDLKTAITIVDATDPDFGLVFVNDYFSELTGYKRNEVIGKNPRFLQGADTSEDIKAKVRKSLQLKKSIQVEILNYKKDGTPFWNEMRIDPVFNESEECIFFVGLQFDITERKKAKEKCELLNTTVLRANKKLNNILDSMSDCFCLINQNWELVYVNRAASKKFQKDVEDLIGKNIWDMFPKAIDSMFFYEFKKAITEQTVVHFEEYSNDLSLWLEIHAYPTPEGGLSTFFRDITDRKKAEDRIYSLAYIDQTTGLPNRNKMYQELNEIFLKYSSETAIILLDVDNFKSINESLGHSAGDIFLTLFAKRLHTLLSTEKLEIYRYGGDEFIVLLKETNKLQRIIDKILESFKKPFFIKGKSLYITSSIGVSLFPQHGKSAEELIMLADSAMYFAKKKGRSTYCLYRQEISDYNNRKIELEYALKNDKFYKQFTLVYQPKFVLSTYEIIGFEALVRWNHPLLGFISPNEFIPLAEETGLIISLGRWILNEACKQLKYWQKISSEKITVSVNVSPMQLEEKGFEKYIVSILKKHKLNPQSLTLEITESTDHNTEITIPLLFNLKQIGIKLSVDDFGKGYSTFNFLRQIPTDTIKLDKTLIDNIETNKRDLHIVKALVETGKIINSQVVAEGIETKEQLILLNKLGCQIGQGYLFSMPLSAVEATKLLRDPRKLD